MTRVWGSIWAPFLASLLLVGWLLEVAAGSSDGTWTVKHEAGRCALKGQCGKKSFFGGQLPCPDNSVAEVPDEDTRKKLVAICGDRWDNGAICCDGDQVCNAMKQPRSLHPWDMLTRTDQLPQYKPQACRIHHLFLPSLQGELLQSLLHLYLLA